MFSEMFSTRCNMFFRKYYYCGEKEFGGIHGYYSGYDHVNGSVTGSHCTWLVPRTRASYDNVDGLLTLRVDPLEEGRSTWRAWPNRNCITIVLKKSRQRTHTHVDLLGVRAHIFPFHDICLCFVFPRLESFVDIRYFHFYIKTIVRIFFKSCVFSALVVSSLLKFSTAYFVYIPVSVVQGLCFIGTYNLVPRGTQMPYSASVDLVWVASQNVQEVRVGQLCWIGEGLVD
ncbi:hypothetical protein M9H77_19087 [Catharanthus roseus]|uniref:Uncharacterized protein n=1 Tax=Catharanthus roseus TaxID=4058 RepID=A0ACC0B9D5_CATRO|nr:hypothetical protein M9H77_19087 [Catharanthus roseus]